MIPEPLVRALKIQLVRPSSFGSSRPLYFYGIPLIALQFVSTFVAASTSAMLYYLGPLLMTVQLFNAFIAASALIPRSCIDAGLLPLVTALLFEFV